MARTSTYLNFAGTTEEAFNFYKSVFGTEFIGQIFRFGDVPMPDGQPGIGDDDKQLVMNVQLPILGGHLLMGSDAPESMGFQLNQGNNVYICLDPDTRVGLKRGLEEAHCLPLLSHLHPRDGGPRLQLSDLRCQRHRQLMGRRGLLVSPLTHRRVSLLDVAIGSGDLEHTPQLHEGGQRRPQCWATVAAHVQCLQRLH